MSIFKSKSHEILLPHSRKDSLVNIDNLSTAIRATEHKKSSVSSVKSKECTSEMNDKPDSSISCKSGIKNVSFKIKDEFQNEDCPKELVENEINALYRDKEQMNYGALQIQSKLPHEISDFPSTKRESNYEKRKQFEKTLMDADISQCRNPEINTGKYSSFQVFFTIVKYNKRFYILIL